MRKLLQEPNLSILLLLLLHLVGIIGILSPWSDRFILLTPFHLFFSTLLVLRQEPEAEHDPFVTLTWIGILAWAVEVLGAFSGQIFGAYSFGKAFGPLVFGAPPMIGLKWALLTYAGVQSAFYISRNIYIGAGISALLLVGVDALMEPLANKNNYWFFDSEAGIKNYLSWFIVAYLFSFLFLKRNRPVKHHILGPVFLLIQVLFFATLNMLE